MEDRRPLSKSSMPSGYQIFLRDPEGTVSRWQRRTEKREQYETLRRREAEVKKSPAANADLMGNLEKAYAAYRSQIVGNAKKFLEKSRGNPDALLNLYRFCHLYKLDSFVPFEIFEEAAKQLSESQSNGITDAARSAALSKIEKEKERVKEELAAVSPPGDFSMNNGQIDADLIGEFFDFWASLQRSTKGEVGPQGISLKFCSELEQRTYYRLKLNEVVPARSAKYRPFEPG